MLIFLFIAPAALYSIVNIITYNDYMLNKFEKFLEGESRAGLKDYSLEIIQNGNTAEHLFGHSNSGFRQKLYSTLIFKSDETHVSEDTNTRTPEVDFHEIFGAYGLIYGMLLLFFPFYMVLKSFFCFWKSNFFLHFMICMISSILLLHAFLAGHVLLVFTIPGLWFPLYAFLDRKHSFAQAVPDK